MQKHLLGKSSIVAQCTLKSLLGNIEAAVYHQDEAVLRNEKFIAFIVVFWMHGNCCHEALSSIISMQKSFQPVLKSHKSDAQSETE